MKALDEQLYLSVRYAAQDVADEALKAIKIKDNRYLYASLTRLYLAAQDLEREDN